MKRFSTLIAKAIPLALNDVDTDLIIPAQYLTSVSREGFGQHLFEQPRKTDPRFVFNLPEYRGAQILIANSNFGCGSSREHAVWALQGAGIAVVIAKSFADIFSGNAAKSGLLLITLLPTAVDELRALADGGALALSVDLERQQVGGPGGKSYGFEYDSFRKHCLLNGLDDLDYLLAERAAIDDHKRQATATRFFSTLAPNR